MKDQLIDYYKKMPSKFTSKGHNPNYKDHLMELNFRAIICGGSGTGKTQTILNIIKRFSKTFERLILCTKDSNEPLYNYLKSKLDEDQLQIYENGELPDINEFEKGEMKLIIFDDLVNMKDQSMIQEYFVRGRKKDISMIYSSQSFFKIPKLIRLQANYVFLKRTYSTRDLNIVLSDYNLGVNKKELIEIHKEATRDNKQDFLLIDVEGDPDKRFRHNFLSIISVSKEETNKK